MRELSPREIEVIAKLCDDMTSREAGGALFCSERTVDFHVANALRKVGLKTRHGLTAYATANGLIPAGEVVVTDGN